jgi:hypothetical protein
VPSSIEEQLEKVAHTKEAATETPPQEPAPATEPSAPATSTAPGPEGDATDHVATGPIERGHVGWDFLEIAVGGEWGLRSFEYNDGLTANLRNYQLSGAPLGVVDGGIYPFAASGKPPPLDVGVIASYGRAFGLQSQTSNGSAYDTDWERLAVGVRARQKTGAVDSPVVDVDVAYGEEKFTFSQSVVADAPSVDYQFLRCGAGLRVPIGRFAIRAGGAYLAVLSAGGLGGRFPQASVAGIDALLGASMTLTSGLEARVFATYRRFFYSMNPTPGDAYVAGGGLDQLAGLQGSLAYAY